MAGAEIRELLRMPWRITNEMRRRLAYPYIRCAFAYHGVSWGRDWRILGMPIIQRHRASDIILGDGLSLRSWPRTNPLVPHHPVVFATRAADAVIRVGDDCGFSGTTFVSSHSIDIGDRVQIGSNASVVDTDFHPLRPDERRRNFNDGATAPIVIEDEVFVGMESLILKGVTVGRGSVVGAGSVVSRDVPPGTVVAGNPAAVVAEVT
jgi:acetyltransferase-like isoleucine patch superfamily enzyme